MSRQPQRPPELLDGPNGGHNLPVISEEDSQRREPPYVQVLLLRAVPGPCPVTMPVGTADVGPGAGPAAPGQLPVDLLRFGTAQRGAQPIGDFPYRGLLGGNRRIPVRRVLTGAGLAGWASPASEDRNSAVAAHK